MTTTTYTTRNEAVAAIIDAIEASNEVADARAEYNIDAIADEVIGDYADGYRIADHDEFWAAVARHARTSAQEIADQLNAYEDAHAGITAPVGNLWQDVITRLDQYDQAATEAADPNGASDVVVLRDGSVIRWDAQRDEWYVA